MIAEFVEKALAQIDDLAELKVTLVALRLLEYKQSPTASVTERDLLAHPAVQGLSFAELTLALSLQKAIARGTLLEAHLGSRVYYFANNAPSRDVVEQLELAARAGAPNPKFSVVYREIEKLECVQAYAPTPDDDALLAEWQAQGYSVDELLTAVRVALNPPRDKQAQPRGLKLVQVPPAPAHPTAYFEVMIAKQKPPLEPVTTFEALTRRAPNGAEFVSIMAAIEKFGVPATREVLIRLNQTGTLDSAALLPLLAEQDDASLAFERSRADADLQVRELVKLYENVFGLPPTDYVVRDMKSLYDSDVTDVKLWKGVFDYAAVHKKKSWAFIRKLLMNPSPNIFTPSPVNELAAHIFEQYKRRIDSILPATVANEINTLVQKEGDTVLWESALQGAEKANVLNWNYIRAVIIQQSNVLSGDHESTKQQQRVSQQARSNGRKAKNNYTDDEIADAEKRAEQYLAKSKKRGKSE